MKRFTLLIVLIALFIASNALAAEITVVTEEYPPYEYLDGGKWVGTDVDILREAFKRMGHTLEVKAVPWKRCMKMMKEGTAEGIISLFKTSERVEFLYFPDENLSFEKNVIFAKKGSGLKISSLEDLKKYKLGAQAEYSYGDTFDKFEGLDKDLAKDTEMLLKKFDKDRTQVIIGNELVTMYLNKQLGLRPIEVVYEVSKDPMYVGFSKKNAMGKTLVDGFNKVMVDMKSEGVIDQIMKKYQ